MASQAPSVFSEDQWHSQVDQLRVKVQRWTGNALPVVDVSVWQWAEMRSTDPALFEQIARDGVTVAEQPTNFALAASGLK